MDSACGTAQLCIAMAMCRIVTKMPLGWQRLGIAFGFAFASHWNLIALGSRCVALHCVTIVLPSALHCIALQSHRIVLRCIVLRCIVLDCIAIVLHCIALH